MRYTLALLSLPFLAVTACAQTSQQGPTECFQTCANNSAENGFTCTGLDTHCYCTLDNGKFLPKFLSCLQTSCGPVVYGLANGFSAACASYTQTVVTTVVTTTATATVTDVDTATITSTGTVTDVDTVTLIHDSSTSTYVQTVIDLTTYTVESGTTRVVTLTNTLTNNITTTVPINATYVTTVPTSTDYSTVTTNGTTVTTPVTTLYGTSTVVRNGTTTTTLAPTTTSATGDASTLDANKWALAIAIGLAAIFGL